MKAPHSSNSNGGRALFSAVVIGSALFLGAPAAMADEPAPEAETTAAPTVALATAPVGPLMAQPLPMASPVALDAPERQYRYPGLRIAGIAITSLGLTAAVVGGSLLVAGKVAADNCNTAVDDTCGLGETVIGAITLISSAPAVAIGVPLWIVGGLPPKKPAAASVLPESIAVGPGSATLRWTF